MANIGLTEQQYDTFCSGVLFLLEQFYKDPANKAAYEEWKRAKEQSNEKDNTKGRS